MNITLRAGERFFINGAVIRIDRKATIELLNDVTFLLENHVMQAGDATTLTRQNLFRRPGHADRSCGFGDRGAAREFAGRDRLGAYRTPEPIAGLRGVAQSLGGAAISRR